jgi:hypothetical protein
VVVERYFVVVGGVVVVGWKGEWLKVELDEELEVGEN